MVVVVGGTLTQAMVLALQVLQQLLLLLQPLLCQEFVYKMQHKNPLRLITRLQHNVTHNSLAFRATSLFHLLSYKKESYFSPHLCRFSCG